MFQTIRLYKRYDIDLVTLYHQPYIDFMALLKRVIINYARVELGKEKYLINIRLPKVQNFDFQPETVQCYLTIEDDIYPEVVEWLEGINKGYRNSILKLIMRNALDGVYYHFCRDDSVKVKEASRLEVGEKASIIYVNPYLYYPEPELVTVQAKKGEELSQDQLQVIQPVATTNTKKRRKKKKKTSYADTNMDRKATTNVAKNTIIVEEERDQTPIKQPKKEEVIPISEEKTAAASHIQEQEKETLPEKESAITSSVFDEVDEELGTTVGSTINPSSPDPSETSHDTSTDETQDDGTDFFAFADDLIKSFY